MSPRSGLSRNREALCVSSLAQWVSLRAPLRSALLYCALLRTFRSCSWTKTASVHPQLNLPPQKHWNLTPGLKPWTSTFIRPCTVPTFSLTHAMSPPPSLTIRQVSHVISPKRWLRFAKHRINHISYSWLFKLTFSTKHKFHSEEHTRQYTTQIEFIIIQLFKYYPAEKTNKQ